MMQEIAATKAEIEKLKKAASSAKDSPTNAIAATMPLPTMSEVNP